MPRPPAALLAAAAAALLLAAGDIYADEPVLVVDPAVAPAVDPAGAPVEAGDTAAPSVPRDPGFSERFLLETSRIPPPSPNPETMGFSMRGEYQLRYRGMSDLRLAPPASRPDLTTLGQNHYLYHWFRLNPRLQVRDKVAIVGQIDAPRGLILGDTTAAVTAARDPRAEHTIAEIHPRYLYIEYVSPLGLIRAGQQGSHWGMGILANDGDHRALFGDYQRGSLVERLLLATTPLGRDGPLTIAIAGDLVFEDNTADLIDQGDLALQGVLAAIFRTKRVELGIYGVLRSQTRARESVDARTSFDEELFAGVVDVTSKFNAPVPGGGAYVFGEVEAAAIVGSTTFTRGLYEASVTPGDAREPEAIRSFGAAARLGVVRTAGRGLSRWGDVAVAVEWGYASGDANPYDGVNRRFLFDPNHNVGLVLFDHVLAWKTARSATAAQDPAIVRRPPPGLDLLPSNGGVTGATYINPTLVVRPKRWVDLKAGAVIAQSTADVVDPYHAGVLGSFANYDGGDERAHDLGLELDLGADVRLHVTETLTLDFGVEGGVLFPGRAFEDASSRGLKNQYLVNTKVGVSF